MFVRQEVVNECADYWVDKIVKVSTHCLVKEVPVVDSVVWKDLDLLRTCLVKEIKDWLDSRWDRWEEDVHYSPYNLDGSENLPPWRRDGEIAVIHPGHVMCGRHGKVLYLAMDEAGVQFRHTELGLERIKEWLEKVGAKETWIYVDRMEERKLTPPFRRWTYSSPVR